MIADDFHMAKRGKNKRSRRRNTAINLLNVAEAYIQTSIWTEAAFNSNPWDFLTAGTAINPNTKWTGQGESVISARELLMWPSSAVAGGNVNAAGNSRFDVVSNNIKGELFGAILKTAGVGVGFKVARKLLSKPRRQINQGLKAAQLNTMIKV